MQTSLGDIDSKALDNNRSHCDLILEHLKQGHSITSLAALDLFGCFRLGARIWDLKHRRGYDIETEILETVSGKRIAQYRLRNRAPQSSEPQGAAAVTPQ